ncbi:MAG: ABC-F family ATP-binding cassette domain-containing protein [Clostridiales bacterium]|nr:ABC-F family ATP-binding cassette domain-containing protein [Clostridiales bacterium]
MVILSGDHLAKSFGERTLFSDVSFTVQNQERIGFVGANGTGKTTLINIVIGREEADAGGLSRVSGLTVGYLAQHACADSPRTCLQETLTVFQPLIELEAELEAAALRLETDHSAQAIEAHTRLNDRFQLEGGLTFRARTRSALMGLGFTESELTLPVSALSGGQKSKIGLARLLLSAPGLMLLDEPTNHLDIPSVEWLEDFLLNCPSACIIVSHDRYFLDKVTNRTFELEHGKLTACDGNYSRFLELKAERRAAQQKQYDTTIKEIKRIEGIIAQQRQWNREKNIKTAESKQKQVDRLTATLDKPENELEGIRFQFDIKKTSGNDVLEVRDLSTVFPGRVLYENACLDIKRGERVFLIGGNGCGKTTLLKQILSEAGREESGVRLGSCVSVGYFDQTGAALHPEKTAIDEIWDAYPKMTQTQVRNALAVFLFKGEDVFKRVSELSGGERARVALCKLMLAGDNLLLLDEPTNHLDLYAREALEEALTAYPGSLLAVSHDRYFINKLAHKVCRLTQTGLETYAGDYDRFLSLSRREEEPAAVKKTMGAGGRQYKERKQQEAELRRLRGTVGRCEEKVSAAEAEIESLQLTLSDPAVAADYEKTMELTVRIAAVNEELEGLMEEWDQAVRRLEEWEAGME